MDGVAWQDLLTRLGCLDSGRFICPPNMREVTIIVSLFGGGVSLMLSRGHAQSTWSYSEDFIVYQDAAGHASYYSWSGVASVLTNPM